MSSLPTGSAGRSWAIQEVSRRTPRIFDYPKDKDGNAKKISEIYGSNTFTGKAMRDKLPKNVYVKLQETIKRGAKLDKSLATEIAHAVKEWAIENGATHFCHWFQPQTGLTAEKHDAFITYDDEGSVMERFSGSQLIQSEPDASSFPSGGMRATFEARGYTAWDPSSPIFLAEDPNGKTLCIPSVFISYHSHALDNKTPLLRSMEVLNQSALKVLKLFGSHAERVVPTLGAEQEYFLIDYAFYTLRPDLISAGRTLIGAKPPKGQELEDHYFGSIKDRVQSFMQEVEYELYKLGVPIKTRHNEVAPSQFETAPIFEEANIAADHNQMTMEMLRSVARRHNLALLLHEKPFAGINGSGKHNNWALSDDKGNNLLEPGKTPSQNLQFLVFLAASLKAVHKRAGILRASIAGSGNDHRLGANEAPPAIISAFLGEQLTDILDRIERGEASNQSSEERLIALGISQLPDIARDYTDRNRTSPFAFTGNKFEFRAVASSATVSIPMAYLNAAVAEALDELSCSLGQKVDSGVEFNKAVLEVLREAIIETKNVRFEGNGYSQEWVDEAARRGLLNLAKTPEALAQMVEPSSLEFFEKSGVFTKEEVEARYHVNLERYIKDIEIEVHALKDMVRSMVLPAAYQQQENLASSIIKLKDVLGEKYSTTQTKELVNIASAINRLQESLDSLSHISESAESMEDLPAKAAFYASDIMPAMGIIRDISDYLEEVIADDLWPLPKYREMLFLS
ncbi:MAG: L-glutamine synthetase [Chloroflexi bacterium]|jgi:glutamine synthetase|nr:L-glutamine synthetase [Chloroflexota bacterium]